MSENDIGLIEDVIEELQVTNLFVAISTIITSNTDWKDEEKLSEVMKAIAKWKKDEKAKYREMD